MSVLDLARPEIRAIQPYSSARMEASGGKIMLNANESAWAPPGDDELGCNRYPDPQPQALLDALAALYGVLSRYWPAVAVMRLSTYWSERSVAPVKMPSLSSRRPSACTR
jgi:histidinol-phosphate/aromatic aminotransferase/cobyric acid decarboxylase-like protein